MSENNQIQEISSLIEETKVLLFNEILKSILKSKNAPFSEDFYFAPTNLHFSLDLFMSAYGKPQ